MSGPEDVAQSIERLHGQGVQRIVLAGGDGMVHLALPALVGSEIVTGIIPTGTGNDFCRGLGLPHNGRAAIEHSVSTTVNRVDVLELQPFGPGDDSGSVFAASVATLGFSGRVNESANRLTFPRGTSRYTLATFQQLRALEPVQLRLSFDDEPVDEVAVSFMAISNTPYFGGGMKICPDAVCDDGLMDVVVVEPVSAMALARVLPLVFSGKHLGNKAVSVRRCRSLSVEGNEQIWADGEPLGVNSARVSLRAGALRVAGTLG